MVAPLLMLTTLGTGLLGCGGDDSDGSTPRPEPPAPQPAPELPEDGDAVVAQFTTGGGLSGPCCPPGTVPEVTAYADGRIVVDGTQEVTVDPEAIADLLAGARDAGLLEDPAPDTGALCCDLAYTDVVLADRTGSHQIEVMGLGGEDNANADLTAEQRALREALSDLRSGLEALAG